MVDAEPHAPAPVKSAMRTLDIIEFVVSRGRPLVAQEIAAALGIPVSSLSYLLATLVDRRYLTRDGRRYSAGPGLERLQAQAPAFSLTETVAPLLRTLRIQLNETISFFVRRGSGVECLATEISEQALRYAVAPGRTASLHGFSAGKALLAVLDDDEFDRYLREAEREVFTPTTIADAAGLRAEVATIRERGIAYTREEYTPGIVGIGRAARMGGEVVGAFSFAIPIVRFNADMDRRAVELLVRTTDLLAAG